MKSKEPSAEGKVQPPKSPTARRPRNPRRAPTRTPLPRLSPSLGPNLLDVSLQRWFEEETDALQRLAHTQRLKGDYVAAQILEREIRLLAADVTALLHSGKG